MTGPAAEGLSIVIPAYNEARRITRTLHRTVSYLHERGRSHEILVVDDGSFDDTVGVVEALAAEEPTIAALRLPMNRGKGAAVREGMLAARFERVLFMDADLSTPIEELEKLDRALDDGNDIAIGSRALPESDLARRQPLPRELMGRTFNVIVQRIALLGFRDTQCGFKLFRRAVARDLFGRQRIDGFAFDVEVLFLAKESGYRVGEVPVRWQHEENSRVNPLVDSSKMLLDVLRLRALAWWDRR